MRKIAGLVALLILLGPCALIAQGNWPRAVDPVPALEIGDTWADSEEFIFSQIQGIAVVGDSILVLEGQANEIRVFDHEGQFLGRVGGTGEGPGEFQWATEIRVVPEGFVISDLSLRRQTYFSFSGEVIRTERLGETSDVPLSEAVRLRGDQVIAETSVMMSNQLGAHPDRALVRINPETRGIDTIARYFQGVVPYSAEGSYGFLRPRTGSEGGWAAVGDSLLVVVSGEPPVLRWWKSGSGGLSQQRAVQLPVRPEPFTRGDEQSILQEERNLREVEGSQPLPRSVEVGSPDNWGQIGRVVVSEDNQCWIQWDQPRTDPDPHWFRIDLATEELSRAELPAGFRMFAATRDRVYGVMLTELDAPIVTVYRLIDGGSD